VSVNSCQEKEIGEAYNAFASVELPNAKRDAAQAIQLLEETKTENSCL